LDHFDSIHFQFRPHYYFHQTIVIKLDQLSSDALRLLDFYA